MLSDDIAVFQLSPVAKELLTFQPGQYCLISDPDFEKPEEEHIFSIASEPENRHHLEFAVRAYGRWTKNLLKQEKGKKLKIRGFFGKFLMPEKCGAAVFLVGGVGISPVISILRHLARKKSDSYLRLFYGNRTPDSAVYGTELKELEKDLPGFKVIEVFSESPGNTDALSGFISRELLTSEIDMQLLPVFFISGPPVFLIKMAGILKELGVPPKNIKMEKIISPRLPFLHPVNKK